jgi:hypothetical protein
MRKQSKLQAAIGAISRRLREPATYAGIGILGVLFGVKEIAEFSKPEVAAAIAAVAAMVLPEGR